MRVTVTLLAVIFHALLSSGMHDEKMSFISLVDMVEFDYEDKCEQRAEAAWEELMGLHKGLTHKLERDKAFGLFSLQQKTDIASGSKIVNNLGSEDEIVKRKVMMIMQPGDTLLDTDQWIRLVSFADVAMNRIRMAENYDCGTNTSINCNLRELHNSMAKQHDEKILQRMKKSWENNLPNYKEYTTNILPMLINASRANNFSSVEDYWDFLAEYEGARIKVRELWYSIEPLYLKLHKYIALRLKGAEAVGKPLPAYLFKSLTGDDWTNLIEILLPKHADVYQKTYANLQLKELGGLQAFKEANNLLQALNLEDVSHVLNESVFNGSCPTVLVDFCQPHKLRAVSCKDVSIGNYLDAHESVMKIKYKETMSLHSNNTYFLRDAPRYSAVLEAIPGLASLLALNPHALDRAGLYSLTRFNYNPNYHRLVLQLIMALRDLPKLNFYLAADEWRIKFLMSSNQDSKMSSWAEFRKNFSLIENSDEDILGDPYVVSNKPYIGKFMGMILKYQIYQSFAEELMIDELDLLQHIAENNNRIIYTMMQGYAVMWPDLVSDLLAKRENGLEYTGVTDYYRLLDEYLDSELDPSSDSNNIEDYVDVVEPEHVNEIPQEVEATVAPTHENMLQPHDHDNMIGPVDESIKSGVETSTVAVMEIKNAPKEEKAEASYGTYWWIGIAVVVAIVVILVAVIARKRHSHRKQLERQRRENTNA